MVKCNIIPIIIAILLIPIVMATEINLLEEEPNYKITIEGSNIETITLETTQSEISNFIQESKEMNRWEKFNFFLKRFELPVDLIMGIIGGYFNG